MRMGWALSGAAVIGTVALAQSASANEGLLVMQDNPAYWVMPLRDYASTRYSDLGQIDKSNVGDLQVAWTFSTGVLRGHEAARWWSATRCTSTRRSPTSSTRSI